MKRYKLFLASLYLVLLSGAAAVAQVHFTYTNTGNNAIVGIPTSANPNINGTPLANGDEIGAFTPAGLCVGAVVWSSTNTALTVWGDNDMTPTIDGIQAGEQIFYRVWCKSTNSELTTVNVSYSQGNGTFVVNGIYILSSLASTGSLSAPTLSSPPNGATGISITPTLAWNAVPGATSYQLQVSTRSNFSRIIVNQIGMTGTSYTLSGLARGTTYYWRINAANAAETSPYSPTWMFKTLRKGVKFRGVFSTEEIGALPTEYSLSENYPNPFNPSTTIEFLLPQPSFVTLKVFNILGQEVASLLNHEVEAGTHRIAFDASAISRFSTQQAELGSGVYLYRLTTGEFTATKKMVLIR